MWLNSIKELRELLALLQMKIYSTEYFCNVKADQFGFSPIKIYTIFIVINYTLDYNIVYLFALDP